MRVGLAVGLAALALSVTAPKFKTDNDDSAGSEPPSDPQNADKYDIVQTYNQNDSFVCDLKCQQGTIYYPDKTCRCECKKNFVLHNEEECRRAFWSPWSSWSKCLKSDWGGLQRRERTCRVLGHQSPGACVGRGSMARTCTTIKREFRIRKNLKDLSDEELHDLLQAMTKFKKDRTKRGYRNIISWHGYPGRCSWYSNIVDHNDSHCSFHNHPLFQPWHRLITIQLELGLSQYLKNKSIGIPFWDWTDEATDLPLILKYPRIYDPILKIPIENPFYRTFIRTKGGVRKYNLRMPFDKGLAMSRYRLEGAIKAILCHDHRNYDNQLSKVPHAQIHDSFCRNVTAIETDDFDHDDCKYSLVTTQYSAWDPAFLLHHSAIDRLFVIRRKLEEQNGVADWTRSRVIGQYVKANASLNHDSRRDIMTEAFDWPMSPFCNKSMNPEPITRKKGVWTMRNAFYEEQLFGYKYDNFNFGHNYKWEDLQRDYKRNVINRRFWNDEYFTTKLGDLEKEGWI